MTVAVNFSSTSMAQLTLRIYLNKINNRLRWR